jgi:hypothetical protein
VQEVRQGEINATSASELRNRILEFPGSSSVLNVRARTRKKYSSFFALTGWLSHTGNGSREGLRLSFGTLTTAGTYQYCQFHSWMKETITVVQAA